MEQNITLQIDNHIVEVAKGTTILEAARGVGIQIPSLCYMNLKDMCITNLPASCRICVVEVEGRRNLAPACATRGAQCPENRTGINSLGPPQRLPDLSEIRELRITKPGR